MGSLLIEGGLIFTGGKDPKILTGHSLLVDDGVIQKIAPCEEFKDIHVERRISANGQLVMPGFINAHTHFYSAFALGLGNIDPSSNFNEVLKNLWWRLDRKLSLKDCYYSALLGCFNAIKQGTTTLFDHHASPYALTGSLEEIERAVIESGVRGSLCYEISDRDGEQIGLNGLKENCDFIQKLKRNPHPRVRAMMGLHASFTLNDPLMEKVAESVHDLGVGVHVHTAEANSDQEATLTKNKMRVVERWNHWKLLGSSSICAHGVYLSEKELTLLKDSKTWLVHNPQSNMNNAVGIMDLMTAVKAGVKVGLGTDAMTYRMLEEARVALWAQHHKQENPSTAFGEILTLLFQNNSEMASSFWSKSIGVLANGALADIIIIDYDPPTPMSSHNWGGHMIFGVNSSPVDTTIVEGEILMRHRKLLKWDESQVMKEARSLAQQLWDRF